MHKDATEVLAEYALAAHSASQKGSARANATSAILDTIGVTLAGVIEESADIARVTMAHELESASATGTSTVIGSPVRLLPSGAAFANGVAGHALDYDDVNPAIRGHASSVIVPALFAVAEGSFVSGTALLDAYVVGVGVAGAIATALGIDSHYATGWHPTSTVGTLGAIAGVCRLTGSDIEETRVALAVGASLVGGMRANFGTMTKHLHAGMAASHAIMAARLANSGFTANRSILTERNGYLQLFGAPEEAEDTLRSALVPGFGVFANQADVKKYPTCYQTNRMIDAVLELRSRIDDPEDVATITVTVEPGGSAALLRGRADSVAEARFCPEFLASASLVHGEINFDTFEKTSMTDPRVRRLMPRVIVLEADHPSVGPAHWEDGFAQVVIEMVSGQSITGRCDVAHGDHKDRLSRAEALVKFRSCVDYGRSGLDAANVFDDWSGVESVPDVGPLIRRLASSAP